MQTLFFKFFPSINFKIILVNSFSLKSFFISKDRLPVSLCSRVIYKYVCEQCSSEYVGSTERILRTRVAEHMGNSFRTGRPLTNPPHSSIRLHANNCKLDFNIDQFSILSTNSNSVNLRILESLYIAKLKPQLNDMQSAFPLNLITT